MTWPAAFFFPDKVRIKAYLGSGGAGEVFADEVQVDAEVIDKTELIRSADGDEVVSSSRVTVPLETIVPPGSLVTLWPSRGFERTASVLQVAREENPPPLPSHLVLYLK
ncbi:hypothetical protein [Microbacterium plantarum]|uniref:hypothetical protein n=1 Tax=Microbacterium plantarum TaxID=1816425 RepID=UPI002B46375F|nr:hypothetical protein [Microbacterium plantarum]WRK16120.1 hypothetical protein VC184_09320 [Microbacterium plantarum]